MAATVALVALLLTFLVPSSGAAIFQTVWTSSGVLIGNSAPNAPNVIQYLGVPYGESTVGDKRFGPPVPRQQRLLPLYASTYGPDCPAAVVTSSFGDGPVKLASAASVRVLDDTMRYGNTVDDDCLLLNVWAPKTTSKKAVMVRIPGGGFQKQTTNSSYIYHGQYLANSQDVIVVSMNYRANMFGFPGLPGQPQNVGLLDQRLALEWVRRNIAKFGGDPSRITLFGESAGGTSIDYYSFNPQWIKDPIVNGFIAESGVATSFINPPFAAALQTDNLVQWNAVAAQLNCPNATLEAVKESVSCLQAKPHQEITAAVGRAQFNPTVDDQTVFSDYPQRASAGSFMKLPILTGSSDYEAGIIKVLFGQAGIEWPLEKWAGLMLSTFQCPLSDLAARKTSHVPLWRYRFFVDFPNTRLTLNPGSGSWHGSWLPIVFGTAAHGGYANTPSEEGLIDYVQNAWAAFAKDPHHGLEGERFQWPRYNPEKRTVVRLGYQNETTASLGWPATYDYPCPYVLQPGGATDADIAMVGNYTACAGGQGFAF